MTSQFAGEVIPLFPQSVVPIHLDTIFGTAGIIWFSASPDRVASIYWSVVNPIEFSVGLSLDSDPCTPFCECFLALYQAENEVVLIFWLDYGQISPQILTVLASIALFQRRGIFDVITRGSIINSSGWTVWLLYKEQIQQPVTVDPFPWDTFI